MTRLDQFQIRRADQTAETSPLLCAMLKGLVQHEIAKLPSVEAGLINENALLQRVIVFLPELQQEDTAINTLQNWGEAITERINHEIRNELDYVLASVS